MNKDLTTNEAVKIIMTKGHEIDARVVSTVSEILRLGYESEMGRKQAKELCESIKSIADELQSNL